MLGHYYPGQAYPAQAGLPSVTAYADYQVRVLVGGVDRTTLIRHSSIEVEDVLNDDPNRCTFTCTGFTPAEGQAVYVYRPLSGAREFVGQIISVQQVYEQIAANVAYFVTCTDFAWKLDRRLVTKKWTLTSATTIAQEIISDFTTGFTSVSVVAGLATVKEFLCEEELPSRALARLAAEIGGYYYVDYTQDLHLFITEAATAEAISDALLSTTTARALTHTGDLSQVRTRSRATGGSTSALEHTMPTATLVPIEDAKMFVTSGGFFRTHRGPNVGAVYTGKHDGGVSATVLGNVAAPGSAPSAALTPNQVGVLQGAYEYKVAFGNDQGETTPSATSGVVTGVAFTPPVAGSAAASGVLGPLVGVYLYVLTYVTALGETSAGSSFGRTAIATAAPGAGSVGAGATIGKLIGAYGYRVTFVTPFGETEGGTVFSRTAVGTGAPGTPSVGTGSSVGRLVGSYGYKITTVDAYGESAASAAGSHTANTQTGPSTPTCTAGDVGPLLGTYYYKIAFVGCDVGRESLGSFQGFTATGTVAATPSCVGTIGGGLNGRGRVAWCHPIFGESQWSAYDHYDGTNPITFQANSLPTGCTWVCFYTGPFTAGGEATAPYIRGGPVFTTTGAQNIDSVQGTAFVDNAGDTMGNRCSLSNIATGNTGTTARRIYRTKAGAGSGGPYYLVGEIGDNSTTTFTDLVPDEALTVQAPLQNLNGEQHALSSISTGSTGTTKRRIYRTAAGGSVYYLLDEILDNSTTTYTDNIPDSSLNLAITAPASATSGDQHALTSIPTGPSGTTARKIYRTLAGGSIYYLLHTLADNVTTTYTDNKPDVDLGAEAAPTTTTAGGQVHALSAIPVGPTGTLARRIYRTIAGGTSYRFVGELTDNIATTFTDSLADAALSQYVPLVNTAGANKITVSSIAVGGSGVTKRLLYRTEAGGTVFKYVATINDNATTSYIDNIPDSGLGREALTEATIGALAGDTTLVLSTVTGWPTAGWAKAGGGLIRWTGISSTTLTGIPGARATTITRSGTTATATTTGAHGFASGELVNIRNAVQPEYNGAKIITVTSTTTFTFDVVSTATTPATGTILTSAVGAILSSIPGGSGVVTAPFLSGVSGLTYPIERGAPVRIYVVRNDTSAQTALALLEGGDGIHEAPIDDGSIQTVDELTAAADAELAAWSTKIPTVTFRSRDPRLRSGKTVTLSLGAPTNLSGTFLIQRVISSEFDAATDLLPMRQVTAAPQRWTFQQVLAHSPPRPFYTTR